MSRRKNEINWDRIGERISDGRLTPFIGSRVGHDGFLTSEELIQTWAEEVGYPIRQTRNLTRVSQFHSVTDEPVGAKEDYLRFLKRSLLERVRTQNGQSGEFLKKVEGELKKLDFSQVAARLKYPDFDDEYANNPLNVLAQFDIPIYVTTNYHSFMAEALSRRPEKTPRIKVCPWYYSDEEFDTFDDEDFKDDLNRPIVYHLYGLDSDPASLVLTEDDHLDFLVRITEKPEVIPYRIRQATADSTLLLMGYELQDWDFRVLFRGLIKNRPPSRFTVKSICIQLDPEQVDNESASRLEEYSNKYFLNQKFEIYWGDVQTFTQELWEHLGA